MPLRVRLFGMPVPDQASGRKVLPVALVVLSALAALEWYVQLDVSLGIFYTIPVMIAGLVLNRSQTVLFALASALVRGVFTPANSQVEFWLKYAMASIAYCGAGLLIVEMSNNRRLVLAHYARLKLEQERRMRAEEQLRILAESSPAAILTLDSDMTVLAANLAAHEMVGMPSGELVGQRVGTLFPLFGNALKLNPGARPIRTAVNGWAQRANGQKFPVQAWFSIYGEGDSKCLAAIAVDISEEVRDRELDNMQHLLDYNRLLAGAVSHEIRNLCSAIAVVSTNLRSSTEQLRDNADFEALQHLVTALLHLASFELRDGSQGAVRVELKYLLDRLRVIIEPDWTEIDGSVVFDVAAESLPAVQADSYGVLQIFLNLSHNSCRAVSDSPQRSLRISAVVRGDDVIVSFMDSGPGVKEPSTLFQPFRPGADGSGLGLYISRELARSFGGDLVHVPDRPGCRFDVILPLAHAVPRAQELQHAVI